MSGLLQERWSWGEVLFSAVDLKMQRYAKSKKKTHLFVVPCIRDHLILLKVKTHNLELGCPVGS